MKSNLYIGALSIIISGSMILLSGCNEPELKSKWRDREIAIDGIDREWEGCSLYYDEDTRTTIGIYNDKTDLYIRFATADHQLQRQIVGQGFTVWFDSTGGKDKQLGISYPTGIMDSNMFRDDAFDRERPLGNKGSGDRSFPGPPEDGQPGDRNSGDRDRPNPSILLDNMMKKMPQVVDIKIPDGIGGWDTIFLEKKDNKAIQAKVNHVQDRLVYELKIPIIKNVRTPYGLSVGKRGKIGIGFETTEVAMNKMGSGMRQSHGSMGGPDERSGGPDGGMGRPGGGMSGPGGGMGGPGGGMGGPGGGMSRPGGMGRPGGKGGLFKNRQPEPLELWIKVILSQK